MKPEGSLPQSYQTDTCPYPQPDQSSPLPPDYLLKTLFVWGGLSQNCEKATINFVMSVHLSVKNEQLGCQCTGFL